MKGIERRRRETLLHQLTFGGCALFWAIEGNAQNPVTTAPPPPPAAPEGMWVRVEDLPRPEAPSAVFFELGGAALAYSANYEHRFIPELGLRVGLGVVPVCIFKCGTLVIVPFSMHAILMTEGRHHIELGAGATVVLIDDDDGRFAFPEIGYRYERPDGGFLFRAVFTPMFRINKVRDFLPWGGVSFGYGW